MIAWIIRYRPAVLDHHVADQDLGAPVELDPRLQMVQMQVVHRGQAAYKKKPVSEY